MKQTQHAYTITQLPTRDTITSSVYIKCTSKSEQIITMKSNATRQWNNMTTFSSNRESCLTLRQLRNNVEVTERHLTDITSFMCRSRSNTISKIHW